MKLKKYFDGYLLMSRRERNGLRVLLLLLVFFVIGAMCSGIDSALVPGRDENGKT